MTTIEQAHNIFDSIAKNGKTQTLNLLDSRAYVLAENIISDVDMPPFNKSAMDGYACRKDDLSEPLSVLEFVGAGTKPTKIIIAGTCSKIMTGAIIPEGADCVIMVEHTMQNDNGEVSFTGKSTKDNICFKGEDVKVGDVVCHEGTIINPATIAIAASVGKTTLVVRMPPKVGIIATGDELIEPDQKPEGPFIRNSNSYNLQAQLAQTPATVQYYGIIGDDKAKLQASISRAMDESDILIITGGVSMGDKDYVPEILKAIGLDVAFDKMAIQPGKPVAFAHGNSNYCFALSGNPVSSLLQFELIVRPFIYKFMGNGYKLPILKMIAGFNKSRTKTDRQQFFPLEIKDGNAQEIEFHGSAHIGGLVNATGFGFFPIGSNRINKGDIINIFMLNQY